jgi:hypothetical protein
MVKEPTNCANLEMVSEYASEAPQKELFLVSAFSGVFDGEDVQSLIDSSLDFYYRRYADQFEKNCYSSKCAT